MSGSSEAPAADPKDDAEVVLRARVIVDAPIGLLDYRIPHEWAGVVTCGVAVRVPLGNRRTSAYVVEVVEGPMDSEIVLKDLSGLDAERPALPIDVIQLLLFAAAYYAVAPGEMLSAGLPAAGRPSTQCFVITSEGQQRLRHSAAAAAPRGSQALMAALAVAARFPRGFTVVVLVRQLQWTRAQALSRLKKLCTEGWLRRYSRSQARARTQKAYTRCVSDAELTLPPRQRRSLALLARMPLGEPLALSTLVAWDAGAAARLRHLCALGVVTQHTVPKVDAPAVCATTVRLESVSGAQPEDEPEGLAPTLQQQEALRALLPAIEAHVYAPFLLHGVTSSGKTEVYLRAIAHALRLGRTALVLVPEIALTPQLGARFRQRFGDRVATFHSGLTVAERRDEWDRVAQGRAPIGLGARSALFLPLENLGVVIVDEEHETSFKQDESPRYNARDLALWRARQQDAVIILGSATPSLETYAHSTTGRFTRLALPVRVAQRPMPHVDIIDLAHTEKANDTALTLPLAEAMEATFLRGEQAILFLNRRGFAPYIFCRDCGHSYRCDDCDVALTLHQRRDVLLCHYCGHTAPTPQECHGCHGDRVGAFGLGTERLEAEVRSLFAGLTTARLDRDTIKTKAELEKTLHAFRQGNTQLLIGTQMVTKGHDFANVTLVGVIAADASLNFPDFRAAERTFQLLTQVAGRAGRGSQPGRVLIQAYETAHYAVQTARTHDYEAFVTQEMQTRQELRYPPFTFLAQVRFECAAERQTMATAEAQMGLWRHRMQAAGLPVTLLGPAVAPLARLRGLWRVHALLKADTRPALRQAIRLLPPRPPPTVRRILDVDPVSML